MDGGPFSSLGIPARNFLVASALTSGAPVDLDSCSATVVFPEPISPPTANTIGRGERPRARARASSKYSRASLSLLRARSAGVLGSEAREHATVAPTPGPWLM